MTELYDPSINILDANVDLPEVPIINSGDLTTPNDAEQWESVIVGIQNAGVIQNDLQYELFSIDDGTGEILVDDQVIEVGDFFQESKDFRQLEQMWII